MRAFLPILCTLVFACPFGLMTHSVHGQEDLNDRSELIVYVVRNGPVSDLAKTLNELFQGDERLRIVPEVSSNTLLIRSAADLRDPVLAILNQIDKPAKVVAVEIQFVRAAAQQAFSPDFDHTGPLEDIQPLLDWLRDGGEAFETQRVALTSLENQKAMVQIGKLSPVLSGSTSVGSRGRANQYSNVNSGTLLSVMHRVVENRIVLDLQFENSEIQEETVESDSEKGRPPSIATTTIQTTIVVNDGESYVLNATSSPNANPLTSARLIVTATILHAGDSKDRQSTLRANSSDNPESRTGTDRFQRFADAMMKRYDTDGDGRLSKEEAASMQRKVDGADVNEDGFVTQDELVRFYMRR